jgi:DNA-binding PadR family transcriptional regulator
MIRRTADAANEPAVVTGVPLLILTSLASGAKHGHALMKDIESFAGERLGPGTLYKAISRLDELGLIEAQAPDARRQPYGITLSGAAVLERSLDRLGHVVREGERRLGAASLVESTWSRRLLGGSTT